MITAIEFAHKNRFSKTDTWAVEKMFNQDLKTEFEWQNILKDKFVFEIEVSNSLEELQKEDKFKKK